MLNVIIKTFFIDFAFLLLGIVVCYFLYVALNAIKNGRYNNLTDDNIFSYSIRLFLDRLHKNIPVIIKLFIVIYVINCICNIYENFTSYISENVNYETVPFVALLVDILETLLTFITPFVTPVIVALIVIVLLYGLISTMEQYSLRASLKSDILDIAKNDAPLYNTDGTCAEKEEEKEDTEEYSDNNQEVIPYYDNAKKKRRLPKGCFFVFCDNSLKGFCKIVKFLPKIFLVVAICVGANALFLNVKNIGKIVNNQKRINELNMTIKNLSRAEAVCEISMINEVRNENAPYPTKTYQISVLNEEGDPIENQTQVFTLEGEQLAIDTMNINFDYSEISKGEHYNIAYPYRIHSDVVTSENGIPFEFFDDEGKSYPVMYALESSVVYSMDRNSYYQNLNEIFSIAKDETKAAEYGIRSFVGQDIHEPIFKDETYRLIVTGTGGVKLSKVEHLDVEEDFSDEEITNLYNPKDENEKEEKKGFFSTAKDKITNMFD